MLDVSNPENPVEVGFYDTPGLAYGAALSAADELVYVADRADGLRVVDVSDPVNPAEIGVYDTAGSAFGVAMAGEYAYVADWGAGLIDPPVPCTSVCPSPGRRRQPLLRV